MSLRKAFPNGYRLAKSLIPQRAGASLLSAARVAEGAAQQDEKELHASAR